MDRDTVDDNDIQNQYYKAKESLHAQAFSADGSASVQKSQDHSQNSQPTQQYYGGPLSVTAADEGEREEDQHPKSWKEKAWEHYKKESLLIEVSLAILLAFIYPPLGAIYTLPDITAHWIAVILIFFLSGFALRLEQISNAASNFKFNTFVIIYNFFGISFVVNIVAQFFYENEVVSEDLMKGMIICSCLSMPTNMMIILTVAANGDEATALFLSTFMNLMGVFISPLLIFLYMGEDSDIDFINTYRTISLRVLLPVFVGLAFRKYVTGGDAFADDHKKLFTKIRERALVFIVYSTFCMTFMDESDSTGTQILVMAISQIILLASAMVLAWICMFIFFNRQPKLRVCGLFGCCTKTAALGIPLISAIYEDHPKLGIYTVPLLIWYPSQLIIGTMLSSRLTRFVNYKLHKYEVERQMGYYQPKGCGMILNKPSWHVDDA